MLACGLEIGENVTFLIAMVGYLGFLGFVLWMCLRGS